MLLELVRGIGFPYWAQISSSDSSGGLAWFRDNDYGVFPSPTAWIKLHPLNYYFFDHLGLRLIHDSFSTELAGLSGS